MQGKKEEEFQLIQTNIINPLQAYQAYLRFKILHMFVHAK